MNPITTKRIGALAGIIWLLAAAARAYPPAPDYLFYGQVRNEWGDPLEIDGANVFIVSTNGTSAVAIVSASTQPGINYRLTVPMDSARSLRGDPAPGLGLRQMQPYQLKVQIGAATYLPIEMVLSRPIGDPAGVSRLDLTLGMDSDGDGLPDVWEIANGLNPRDPNDADGDKDNDGVSNREEYLAGTFPFDANDGFRLTLLGVNDGDSTLEFFVARGRTYTVHASPDLRQWTPVNFRPLSGGLPGVLRGNYSSDGFRMLQIQVPTLQGTTNRFFRALVQ